MGAITIDLQSGTIRGLISSQDGPALSSELSTKVSTTNGTLTTPTITTPTLKDERYTYFNNGTVSGSTTINTINGNIQSATIGGATTININWNNADSAVLVLRLTNAGAAAISIPNCTWVAGDGTQQSVPPVTFQASGTDIIQFTRINSSVYGKVSR